MTSVYYSITRTPLGFVGALYGAFGLRKLSFPNHTLSEVKHELLLDVENAQWSDHLSNSLFRDLGLYLRGHPVTFCEQLDFGCVSKLNLDVWRACLRIGFGSTRSYKWVAEKAGHRGAYRAVGHALSMNPMPILVPCHRVIGIDGRLRGYGGGLVLKSAFLKIERDALNS